MQFLTVVFYLKRTWKKCFFIFKTRDNLKFQYQQSYMSYEYYIELHAGRP